MAGEWQVGDEAFITIIGHRKPELRHIPIRSVCVVQPRSVPAVSLLLSCDWEANPVPDVINIPSAERPFSSPDPLQNEPWEDQLVCCLSVCVGCVFLRASSLSVFKFVNISHWFALLSVCVSVSSSVCLLVYKPAYLFSISAPRHSLSDEQLNHIFVLPHW